MQQWQYRTVIIVYEKKEKDWVLHYKDAPKLVGFQAALDSYGEKGWELVSLTPEESHIVAGLGRWYRDVASYRATFKRPVAEKA